MNFSGENQSRLGYSFIYFYIQLNIGLAALLEGSFYARLHQKLLRCLHSLDELRLPRCRRVVILHTVIVREGVAYHVQYELVLFFKCKYFLVDPQNYFTK